MQWLRDPQCLVRTVADMTTRWSCPDLSRLLDAADDAVADGEELPTSTLNFLPVNEFTAGATNEETD